MTLQETKAFLLWCALFNYGILLAWFGLFTLAHDKVRRLHGRWFRLTPEHFDAVHYAGMATYKIGVLLLNVVPLAALYLISG